MTNTTAALVIRNVCTGDRCIYIIEDHRVEDH